ncbi:MAG: ABC transporter transmembrane domain-containing protein [Cyanobacteria bacterium P01_A01_bin.84]
MPSTVSQAELDKLLAVALGEKLSEREVKSCLKSAEIVEPQVTKCFWEAAISDSGIYIVLAGKVRLLDIADNLIASFIPGESFGECTLFASELFQPYIAKASNNLKLCYLKSEAVNGLIANYPKLGDRLKSRAESWDLLMLCRQNFQLLSKQSPQSILDALSLFESHHLNTLDEMSLTPDDNLWLLRQGELVDSDGKKLDAGIIYTSGELKEGNWRATKATVIYILKNSSLAKALEYCPELENFTGELGEKSPNEKPKVRLRSVSKTSGKAASNVIPFRPPGKKQQKPQKQLPYFPSPKVKAGHWWGKLTRQYPFYAQQSISDCGAACLVMIGSYWGKRFSVNKLRDMTNVNRSGASLTAIATAAENLGFSTRPVKATFDKFAEQSLPAIAHWEGKHYIVVYEITNKRVIVCDPGLGPRSLTFKEFKEGWTGYALLIQPTSHLKDAEEGDVGFWKFFELVKPHYKVLTEIFIASVVMQMFGLVTPIFTQLLLDRVLVQRSLATLNAVGLGMIVFGLFKIAMNGVRSYLLSHTANRISISLLVGFIKHTFRLPLSYFESRYVGDIISRVQENRKIQAFLTGQILSITLDMLTLVVYLSLMFVYSWKMALFVLVTVPPFFIVALGSTSILRRISREVFNAGAEENKYLIESLTGIRTVRSLAIEQSVRWRWEELLNTLVKKSFNAKIIGIRLSMLTGVIQTFVSTSLMWFGAWQVIQGDLTVGQLVAFNMLVGNVLSPFQRFATLWNTFQEIIISTERINDVLEAEPEEDLFKIPRKSMGRFDGHICFQNVTFRYDPDSKTNILENINIEIQPEQMVALVGRSGSGKTTLSKLILGLYPPTDGKILIDGHDVNGISLRSLRSQVGVVDQDTFLFGGTVRDNISVAHPEVTLDDIVQVAKLAGADEFIQKLPLGYESQIGEGGGMLSGGQRQRIAIARALLGDPRLLLFDEATSHLDTESERIIQNNLKTILKGRTSIIIAHRLSTVRNADLILVLDRGLLVESGSHDELIAKKGHYYYLNQQQLSQVG